MVHTPFAHIKRDRLDIAVRMAKGEFHSVRAAAREAGIKTTATVSLGNTETVAWRIAEQGVEFAAIPAALVV